METPVASREPTSWNLDQFIKTIPVTNNTSSNNNHSNSHNKQQLQPKPQPKPQPQLQPQPQPPPPPPPPRQQSSPEPQPTPEPQPSPPEPVVRLPEKVPSPVPPPPNKKTPTSSQQSSQQQPSSGSSYIVQIDLSKLKRIPTTKVHTPQSTSNSITTAKALKHEADAERDKTKQAIKYLEAAMYFVLHGYEIETSNRDIKNVYYYVDTIPLFKHTLRLSSTRPDNHDNMTNLKVHTLCLRCLSLLYMKLYKLRERELHEHYKTIKSHQNSSPIQQADSLVIGVKPQLLNAYEKQLAIYNYLRYANDYWQQADQFCDQHPAVRIFFSTIESNCGTLTMISQFTKLMNHVKCGLKLLRTS